MPDLLETPPPAPATPPTPAPVEPPSSATAGTPVPESKTGSASLVDEMNSMLDAKPEPEKKAPERERGEDGKFKPVEPKPEAKKEPEKPKVEPSKEPPK